MLPDLSDRFVISPDPGQFFLKLRLPEDVYCDQCILQVGSWGASRYMSASEGQGGHGKADEVREVA